MALTIRLGRDFCLASLASALCLASCAMAAQRQAPQSAAATQEAAAPRPTRGQALVLRQSSLRSSNLGVCYSGETQAIFTGSISGGQLSVTAISYPSSGRPLAIGQWVWWPGMNASQIIGQVSGTPGGPGVYMITDTTDTVPSQTLETAGTTIPTSAASSGTLTLNNYGVGGFGGYNHCNITVNNVTVVETMADDELVVNGNNNIIDMNGTKAAYDGFQAHAQVEVNGNNNTTSPAAGGLDTIVNGTGNVIWANGNTVESQHGNTIIAGAIYWKWDPGLRAQSVFDPSGAHPDTLNLVPYLTAHGCSSPSSNNPPCASGSNISYDAFSPNNAGAPGFHNYSISGSLCNRGNPCNLVVDCTGAINTLSGFVRNPNVVTGGTAPTPPPRIASPSVTWPNGIPPNLGPLNVTYLGSTLWHTPHGYGNMGYQSFGNSWLAIFDPWANANGGTVTVRYSLANGSLKRTSLGSGCSVGSSCYQWTNLNHSQIHEIVVAVTLTEPAGISSDTLTVTMSNSGGGSYTVTFPIRVQQGRLCP